MVPGRPFGWSRNLTAVTGVKRWVLCPAWFELAWLVAGDGSAAFMDQIAERPLREGEASAVPPAA
jgi:hypothetical protein